MERASLDISRDEELLETVRSFSVLYEHHKGFKERDAMKKYMGWSHYSFGIYFQPISFIWPKTLVPGVPN